MAAPDGGGDSIHVGLDGIPITYGGVGLSTYPIGEWNWEYISINVTSNNYTQLNIWMREDGVMIDSLILTSVDDFDPYISENLEQIIDCNGNNVTFSTDLTFSEDQGLIIIEAEDYSDCSHGVDVAENSFWELESNFSGFTGQGYMEAIPDNKVKTGNLTFGPHLKYNISISTAGVYHLWLRLSAPDGGGDSIHIGLNGILFSDNELGLSTPANNQWNWEFISLNITSAGINQLDIWMREDGIRIDSLVVTTDLDFVP